MADTSTTITAAQVKDLRDRTGAGMMECKKALQETGGDTDKAVELLRVRLGDKALKLGGRETSEGTVQAYIHSNAKVGVLVEVDCNTDFVARNPEFVDFAKAVAMHVAAVPTIRWVGVDEVPEDAKNAELRVFEQQAADTSPDPAPTAGAVEADPGSSTSPGADAQAAAEAVREADTNETQE